MTLDEKIYFVYGVAYGLALKMQEKGKFKEMTTKDIALMLLSELV